MRHSWILALLVLMASRAALTQQRIRELLDLLHPVEGDVCHSPWP